MILERAFLGALGVLGRHAIVPFLRHKLRTFEAQAARARDVQREVLFAKLARCAESRFGRAHRFGSIRTIEDFRRQVPISDYDYVSPYIKDVADGKIDALFPADEKILAFACTSGTSREPKLNPIARTWLAEYRRGWDIWGVKAFTDHPSVVGTRLLQLTGPANLGRTATGLTVGMVSAVAARLQNKVLRQFYATPCDVSEVQNATARYYSILRLAIVQKVGMVVGITPNNLIRLAETGNEQRQHLIRDIHDGTLRADLELPPEFRQLVAQQISVKHVELARRLEQVVESTGTLYPKDFWPVRLISCWLGGTIGYQSRDLPRYYGSAPARDMGLLSTEGRHTLPLQDSDPKGVLAIDSSYYEFIPEEEKKSPNPRVLEAHELEEGRDYFLIMTTSSGLYRYDIGDVVRCRGFLGQAPQLEFLHKDQECSDMEGEKISGHQVALAVEAAARALELSIDYFTAVPVRNEGGTPFYAVLVEKPIISDESVARQFLSIIDRELVQQNVMYAGKRNDRYILAPRLMRLAEGAWGEFMAREVDRRGTGDSQYKHPSLVTNSNWLDRLPVVDTVTVDA